MAELDKMVEKDGRIVVAYQGGLYDMTDFTGHPGGVGRLEGCTKFPNPSQNRRARVSLYTVSKNQRSRCSEQSNVNYLNPMGKGAGQII